MPHFRGNALYSGPLLALSAVGMDAVNVYVPEPRRYSTIDFLLQCPKAFIAEVHVSTVRFIERSVSPYRADPEPGRSVASSTRQFATGPLQFPPELHYSQMGRAPSSVRCRGDALSVGSKGCCSDVFGCPLLRSPLGVLLDGFAAYRPAGRAFPGKRLKGPSGESTDAHDKGNYRAW